MLLAAAQAQFVDDSSFFEKQEEEVNVRPYELPPGFEMSDECFEHYDSATVTTKRAGHINAEEYSHYDEVIEAEWDPSMQIS